MILVEVYIPVLDEKDDFELDENVPVLQVTAELVEMLCKKTKSKLPDRLDTILLCSMEAKEILDSRRTLYENGIRDGQTLMIV